MNVKFLVFCLIFLKNFLYAIQISGITQGDYNGFFIEFGGVRYNSGDDILNPLSGHNSERREADKSIRPCLSWQQISCLSRRLKCNMSF